MKSLVFCLLLLTITSKARAADWLQFRGPAGLATSAESNLPTRWSHEKNVRWKTELPGAGTSSPIILGDRIYLTCYSGYGLNKDEPGDMEELTRHLVCLDRATGKQLWKKAFQPSLPESAYRGGNDAKHGYSSSTPTTDGERLYLFFGKSGVFAVDLEGETLWHTSVGDKTTGWGSSNSPLLVDDLLVINASVESNRLVALNKKTGEEVWSTSGMNRSWNTPHLVETKDGNSEIVVSTQGWLLGIDPETGEKLWRCDGIPTYACPSPISNDGIVYVTGGRGTQYTMAVKSGGRGDVTDSHLLWRVAKGSNVSSPVYHDGHVYLINDSKGIAFCFDAETGKIAYEKRLPVRMGLVYASALLGGDKIYYLSQHDGVAVMAATPKFELIAHNQFSDDDARANASPVAHDGDLLLRNDKHLYCIGE